MHLNIYVRNNLTTVSSNNSQFQLLSFDRSLVHRYSNSDLRNLWRYSFHREVIQQKNGSPRSPKTRRNSSWLFYRLPLLATSSRPAYCLAMIVFKAVESLFSSALSSFCPGLRSNHFCLYFALPSYFSGRVLWSTSVALGASSEEVMVEGRTASR